jgi:hypothetical protein
MIDVNPAKTGVDNPQRRRVEKRPFESWEEVEAVAVAVGARYGPLVLFAAATGMRPVSGWRWSGVTSTASSGSPPFAADVVQRRAQSRLEVRVTPHLGERAAEAGNRPPSARPEPCLEFADWPSLVTSGWGEAAPQSLLPADGDNEVNPSVGGIEGESAAGPLAIGQIEVLGVGAKRVSAIAAAWDSDRNAGTDHDDRVVKGPTLSR